MHRSSSSSSSYPSCGHTAHIPSIRLHYMSARTCTCICIHAHIQICVCPAMTATIYSDMFSFLLLFCPCGDQGFVQVLDAIQKRQRAEKLLKAQTRKKQLKKNQASQQGYSSSSSSSSASSDLASFPPTLDAASASPPTTTGTPSSSSASPTNPVREEEKRAESTRGDDECNSILSTRNSQGRHEKIKGGGASLHLSEFYFYQASDGQLCFLHPFFIKWVSLSLFSLLCPQHTHLQCMYTLLWGCMVPLHSCLVYKHFLSPLSPCKSPQWTKFQSCRVRSWLSLTRLRTPL